MAENTNTEKVDLFEKQRNKEEMKKQLITFAGMIGFTLVSFGLVATGSLEKMFAIPILFILAIIQVAFQFYYFMHLKDKGHEMPMTLIYGGVWAAFLVIAGLLLISWW
jgi:cytochrome c oxidase subunit 4